MGVHGLGRSTVRRTPRPPFYFYKLLIFNIKTSFRDRVSNFVRQQFTKSAAILESSRSIYRPASAFGVVMSADWIASDSSTTSVGISAVFVNVFVNVVVFNGVNEKSCLASTSLIGA
jgi:hypothetical protein